MHPVEGWIRVFRPPVLGLEEVSFLEAVGAEKIPAPSTAGDFVRRFQAPDVVDLMEAVNESRRKVWAQQPASFFQRAEIDVDGTIAPTSGECKEGMEISYDGQWGYAPLIVTLAQRGEVLYAVNRSGNRPSHEGAPEWLDRSIELVRAAAFRTVRLRGGADEDAPRDSTVSASGDFDSEMQRSSQMFVIGRVVLDDGNPAPEPVTVEMVCRGSVRQQVFTFGEGSFSFPLGEERSGSSDASVSGTQSNRNDPFSRVQGQGSRILDLSDCSVRGVFPGFKSDVIALNVVRYMEHSDVGTLVLQRLDQVQGLTVSYTVLNAPKKARKEYEKADKELRKENGNIPEAVKNLEKAVKVYPEYAAAWLLMGNSKLALGDRPGAREAFQKSIEADPKYSRPHISLGGMALRDENWQEVARLCEAVTELNPRIMRVHYFYGVANLNLGGLEKARESIQKVLDHRKSRYLVGSHYVMGAILTQLRDFPGAAAAFRLFLNAAPQDTPVANQLEEKLVAWEKIVLIEDVASLESPSLEN